MAAPHTLAFVTTALRREARTLRTAVLLLIALAPANALLPMADATTLTVRGAAGRTKPCGSQ